MIREGSYEDTQTTNCQPRPRAPQVPEVEAVLALEICFEGCELSAVGEDAGQAGYSPGSTPTSANIASTKSLSSVAFG